MYNILNKVNYLDLSPEQLENFQKLDNDGPLQMLNLLKFKKHVEETGLSGEEQYFLYSSEALPFIKDNKARVNFYGTPQCTLIGPDGDIEWDKILIVEYPSKDHFINMITSEGYPSDKRKLALADSRLIVCSRQ